MTSCASSSRWSPASDSGQAGVARLAEVLARRSGGWGPARSIATGCVHRQRAWTTTPGTVFETYPGRPAGDRQRLLRRPVRQPGGAVYHRSTLPGIGASLGLDRLLAAMEELGMLESAMTPAAVFIPYFQADRLDDYLRLAARLRAGGLGVEVYPGRPKSWASN